MLKRFLTRARDTVSGSPAIVVAPLLLLLAVGFWLVQPDTGSTSGSDASIAARQSSPAPHYWGAGPDAQPPDLDRDDGPDRGFDGPPPDDRRDGPPRGDRRRGGGRHHGPPPCLPPTVVFMIGGVLGYLVGTRKKGCCHRQHALACQPPAPPAPPAAQP